MLPINAFIMVAFFSSFKFVQEIWLKYHNMSFLVALNTISMGFLVALITNSINLFVALERDFQPELCDL